MEDEIIKRILGSLIVFFVVLMVFAPSACAWKDDTHIAIAAATYNELIVKMPNLNFNEMQKGAIYPDYHRTDPNYPSNHDYYSGAKNNVIKFLNLGKVNYAKKNYTFASFYYGVALHYISDTYSAPHSANVIGEKGLHGEYESQAVGMTPSKPWVMGQKTIKSILKYGSDQGDISWNGKKGLQGTINSWVFSKNKVIVQKDLNRATAASYSGILLYS